MVRLHFQLIRYLVTDNCPKFVCWLILSIALASFMVGSAGAQSEEDPTIKVGVFHFEPFVITNNGEFTGFSIDLWEEIAVHLDHDFEYVEVRTIPELLKIVANREVDFAVSAIDITAEHEEYADFSFPYFRTGLQLMVHDGDSGGNVNPIESLLLRVEIVNLGIFLLITIIVAHVFWLLERGKQPHIPESYLQGIWEGFWWACVTVTTVGYGDRVPHGRFGRVIALIWIIAGLFLIANLTASIAATITVAELRDNVQNVTDLAGRNIGVVPGDEGDTFIRRLGIRRHAYETIEEALAALQEGEIDAVVYEAPVLRYLAEQLGDPQLQLVGPLLNDEHFGFAFATNDPYREAVNLELLRMIEDGRYDAIHDRWFGNFANEG